MGKTKKIICISDDHIPSAGKIEKATRKGKPLVLIIKDLKIDKGSLLIKLNKMLPDYNIFDSGGTGEDTWITIIPPYSLMEMEWLLPVVKKAIQAYINIGSKLAEDYENGTIAEDWDIFEHGGQRRFENPVTGQVIETPQNDVLNRENLDPHFLINFMKTTAGFNKILKKKKIDFHKMVKLLDIINHRY